MVLSLIFLSCPFCVLAQASGDGEGNNSPSNTQSGTGPSGIQSNTQSGTGPSDLNSIRTDDNIFSKFLNWLRSILILYTDVIVYPR